MRIDLRQFRLLLIAVLPMALYACASNENGYLAEQYADQLGKTSCGKSCIRFKKFEDLNVDAVKQLLKECETAEMNFC